MLIINDDDDSVDETAWSETAFLSFKRLPTASWVKKLGEKKLQFSNRQLQISESKISIKSIKGFLSVWIFISHL